MVFVTPTPRDDRRKRLAIIAHANAIWSRFPFHLADNESITRHNNLVHVEWIKDGKIFQVNYVKNVPCGVYVIPV